MGNKEFGVGLSLGGSVIFQKDLSINTELLIDVVDLLHHRVMRVPERILVVTGGGPFARSYVEGLKRIGVTDKKKLDRKGIEFTRENAKFVTVAMEQQGVNVQYVRSNKSKIRLSGDIIVTGGTYPGQTTDGALIDWAKILKLERLINITNVRYVYKPKKNGEPDFTKPIHDMTWDEYRAITGEKHEPGENWPFGVIGSKKAQKLGLSVIVVGHDITNLKKAINGKSFEGTLIHP